MADSHQAGEPFLNVGPYYVCLIDLLGQKGELKALKNAFNRQAADEVIARSQQSLGTIRNLERRFNQYLMEAIEPSPQDNSLPPVPVIVERFSDLLVVYSKALADDNETIYLDPLLRMIDACGSMMMLSLASGVPFRGGITAGVGMVVSDSHEFYGPALYEAHEIENEVAQWPRVVVSEEVLEAVAMAESRSQEGKQQAEVFKKRICQDVDGRWIVDFLNPQFHAYPNKIDTDVATFLRDKCDSCVEFAGEQMQKFQACSNSKLALRYHLLLSYASSRQRIWHERWPRA